MKVILPLLVCMVLSGCGTSESPEAQMSDAEIAASIKSRLAADLGPGTVPGISVNSTNGVVTLSGQVAEPATKGMAEMIAQSVPTVLRVENNLRIVGTPR